jgi:homogentisate 1,2-dioxygenase
MTYYRRVGDVPRKRHTVHRGPNGERYPEELMGTEGFSRAASLLYHRNSPSALVSHEPLDVAPAVGTPTLGAPLHMRTASLSGRDVVRDRTVLLANGDVRLATASGSGTSSLYRNSFGDELVYVHSGEATLESIFGALPVRSGDYVVIPAGTTHRWVSSGDLRLLVFEASGHVRPPKRYLSPDGQFLEATPYCERDIRGPDEPLVVVDEEGPTEVLVRTREGLALHCYANHPFDVVGWDGYLYPWALSIHDFEPIVGSLHQPPPVHQTFEGPNFVICSFVPRPYDFHPEAVKVPYHHANVDSDEVIFYADGDFMSRAGAGIGIGSITLHPAGFTHGPQPGSWEKSLDKDRTSELAVMLDTFRPLTVTDEARALADDNYLRSWL